MTATMAAAPASPTATPPTPKGCHNGRGRARGATLRAPAPAPLTPLAAADGIGAARRRGCARLALRGPAGGGVCGAPCAAWRRGVGGRNPRTSPAKSARPPPPAKPVRVRASVPPRSRGRVRAAVLAPAARAAPIPPAATKGGGVGGRVSPRNAPHRSALRSRPLPAPCHYVSLWGHEFRASPLPKRLT